MKIVGSINTIIVKKAGVIVVKFKSFEVETSVASIDSYRKTVKVTSGA